MRQYKREPLSDDEVNRLTNACESFQEKLIVFTLLDTGLRVSELAGLRKENILWQERRLSIHGKGGPYGKLSKRRVLPMTERVRLLIEHHYTMEDSFGITKRQIERIVKRLAQRAAIVKPVSPHVLRHTFAVNCIKRGISTRALQTFLGHDRLATTEIYMNLSPEDAIREFREKW
jgi:integrase/recombinase XerD